MNGLLVGCCDPPSRSTVTATTDPLRTGCSSFTATVLAATVAFLSR